MSGVYIIGTGVSSSFPVSKTTVKDDNGIGAYLYLDVLGGNKIQTLMRVGETIEYIDDSITVGKNSSNEPENYYIARYISDNKNIYGFIKESNLNI